QLDDEVIRYSTKIVGKILLPRNWQTSQKWLSEIFIEIERAARRRTFKRSVALYYRSQGSPVDSFPALDRPVHALNTRCKKRLQLFLKLLAVAFKFVFSAVSDGMDVSVKGLKLLLKSASGLIHFGTWSVNFGPKKKGDFAVELFESF